MTNMQNLVNELYSMNTEEFNTHMATICNNVSEEDLYDLEPLDIDLEIEKSWEVELYEEMLAEIAYENRMLAQEFI